MSSEGTRRAQTLTGSSSKAHPSLAKLRDNLLNGTIDFAEVPIAEMNPEDIRVSFSIVYNFKNHAVFHEYFQYVTPHALLMLYDKTFSRCTRLLRLASLVHF